jgi:hypothetical protein
MNLGRIQNKHICIEQKEEEIWIDRVSDGRLKSKQGILLVPEVNMMMMSRLLLALRIHSSFDIVGSRLIIGGCLICTYCF